MGCCDSKPAESISETRFYCCSSHPIFPDTLEPWMAADIIKAAPEVAQPFSGTFYGKVHRVIDGDTLKISIVYGFKALTLSLRLKGIDAPELHSSNPLEKAAGLAVKRVVTTFIRTVGTYEFNLEGNDKFGGRVLGDLILPKKDQTSIFGPGDKSNSLVQALKKMNIVEAYFGAKKKPWTDDRLKEILRICKAHLGEPPLEELDTGDGKIDLPGDGSVTVKYEPFRRAVDEALKTPISAADRAVIGFIASGAAAPIPYTTGFGAGTGDAPLEVLPPPLPERRPVVDVRIDVDDASSGKKRSGGGVAEVKSSSGRKILERKKRISSPAEVKRSIPRKTRDELKSDQTLGFAKTDLSVR